MPVFIASRYLNILFSLLSAVHINTKNLSFYLKMFYLFMRSIPGIILQRMETFESKHGTGFWSSNTVAEWPSLNGGLCFEDLILLS